MGGFDNSHRGEISLLHQTNDQAETLVITTLFPNQPPGSLLPATLSRPLNLLVASLQPTLNIIKKALSSHTFSAIELYQSLSRTQAKWDVVLTKCFSMVHTDVGSSGARELQTALTTPLSTLRGLVLRSFPEFIVDIRTTSGGPSTTSAISDTTHSTLTYLETLPSYEKTVESLLSRSQSERSWLMGAKDPPSPAKSANEEGGIVNLYVGECAQSCYLLEIG